MTFRKAQHSDIPLIAGLILAERHASLSNPPAAIEAQIKRDIDTDQFEWLLAGASHGAAVARIAVIPPPPIYDLKGGLAGVVLGTWRLTDIEPLDRHLRDRGAAMLVMDCTANDEPKRRQLEARGYIATTNYMLKTNLAPQAASAAVRQATERDIPDLVAFNREGRARLHEANPAFWTSHPDAEARFGLWMKFSLTMRDRTMFVSEGENNLSGFIIAQPASPIQVPIEIEETQIGVIDDFHCTTFASALDRAHDDTAGRQLLQAAESAFAGQGKTGAIAICPVAWTAKAALLEASGYKTQHTWFTRPV
jgi:hypothetical protein